MIRAALISSFVMTVPLLLVAPAWAISAGCTAVPTELTRVEGEPGFISVTLGYENDSGSTVTFTTTYFPSFFGPGSSSTKNVGAGVGTQVQVDIPTDSFPSHRVTEHIEITSSATGSTVLGSCDYTITILPTGSDTEGDALLDTWEAAGGIDVDLDGTTDVLLPGADLNRKDLYLELDCLVNDGDDNGMLGDPTDHSHCPRQIAIVETVQAFADAPVANSDGTIGVQLHIDVGSLYGAGVVSNISGLGGVTGTYGDLGGGGDWIDETGNEVMGFRGTVGHPVTSFYDLKTTYFDQRRELAYRYGIFGNMNNAKRPEGGCTSGMAEGSPANDFMVTLGGGSTANPCFSTDANGFPVGTWRQEAGTLMHEFGHCLGLPHGGGDDVHRKPNYLSVMNYAFQFCTVPVPPGSSALGCDFSGIDLDDLDETSLDECVGIGGGLGFGSMDWDGDTVFEGVTNCVPPNSMNVSIDINGDARCVSEGDNNTLESVTAGDDVVDGTRIVDGPNFTCESTAMGDDTPVKNVGDSQPNPLEGFEDWNNLFYAFRTLPVFAPGVAGQVEDEPDPEVLKEAREMLSTRLEPAIVFEKTSPETALPGETVTFELFARNEGMGPAVNVVLTDTLPDGSIEEIELEVLPAGAEVTESVDFTVAEDACPEVLTNTAVVTYQDFVGKELTTDDSADVAVLDLTPPVLEVSVSPDMLWPPNHKFVRIAATVDAWDLCDDQPEIRLVSIISDEPADGRGDGYTEPDVREATFGTDDRSFMLRAERSGRADGRAYTIIYEAEDGSGNVTEAQATVTVAKSQNRK